MKTIKGPAVFLAQFIGADEPFNNLKSICHWAKDLGYKGGVIKKLWNRMFSPLNHTR